MQQNETHSALTPEVEQRILDYAGRGLSGRGIARQDDIPVSQATVNRFLREHREARAQASKGVVREHLAATLPTDLEQLDHLSARLEAMREAAAAGEDIRTELSIIDRQVKTIGLKLKYSGAGEDDSAQRLLEALSGDD